MKTVLTRHLRKCLILILTTMLLICSVGPSFADDIKYLDEEPKYGVTYIGYEMFDTQERTYTWNFPYTNNFFRNPSSEFSLRLAQGSLGLALSAFRCSTGLVEQQYKTYLTEAGFTDLYSFGYDYATSRNSLSGVIGMKKIDDFTVIAAVTCGLGYGKEWAGNLTVGKSVRHEGFENAAKRLEAKIEQYISNKRIEGKKKLWVTGFSRAGAIGNITAADMIESGNFEDVYAYLFGVPRTTKEPVAYSGIYNICGQYDAVPSVPFQSWGYGRYGTDLFTPAQESDNEYPMYAKRAKAVAQRMDDSFRNNPEVNYQLRLIMEALNEMFEDNEDYADRLQSHVLEAMAGSKDKDMITILAEAIAEVAPEDAQEKAELKVTADYLSYVAAQHLRARQRQISDGSWIPDESLTANLMIEHRPTTYVKWLFSQSDPAVLFSNCAESRRITFIGDVSVEVYRDGEGISGIDSKGKVYVPGGDDGRPGTGKQGTFMMRNGSQTVLSLPNDSEYYVIMDSARDSAVSIFDILVTPRKLESEPGRMYLSRVSAGRYGFKISPGESSYRPEPIGSDDNRTYFTEAGFDYSPTVIMSNELDATKNKYLSISGAYHLVRSLLRGLLMLVIACIAISCYHRFKVKRGHDPYSDWYVIAPHLACIVVFAGLTQYVTFYMFAIGRARAMFAAATMFFIFLLALRGAIRSRVPMHILITGFILISVHLTGIYYNNLPINSFSVFNMVMFFVTVALFCALAIRMFRRPDKQETEEIEETA